MGMATKAQVDPGYQMLSLPVALGLRYETFPSSSLFLRVDLTGGMLASFIRFSAPGTEPISTLKPFVQPSLSAGWQLSERFRAGAGLGWGTFFFDGAWVSMMIPFLEAEYALASQ